MRRSPVRGGAFIDTHGLVAVLNASDDHHDAAVAAFALLVEQRRPVWCSDWVLAEFLCVAATRTTRSPAAAIVGDLRRSALTTIIEATRADWDSSFRLFRTRKDKDWSFIDCTTIVLCDRLGIREVMSHDHHFTQAGLMLLLP